MSSEDDEEGEGEEGNKVHIHFFKFTAAKILSELPACNDLIRD